MKKKLFKNEKGQSLVEVIVAVAIFSLVALATSILFLDSITSLSVGNELNEASSLTYEGLDAARSIRDSKWLDLTNGTHGLTTGSGFWEFSGSDEVIGDYTRTVTVADVDRDSSFDIIASGINDPRTKLVTTVVTWNSRGSLRSTTTSAYLTDWNVFDWEETTDGEFGLGVETNTDVQDVGTDAYLALLESTSSCQILDDEQAEFDTGTYSDTQWLTDRVKFDATGFVNGLGSYTSEVFDQESASSWDTLTWTASAPYGKELPDSGGIETAYVGGTPAVADPVGTISDSIIDSFEYDTLQGEDPSFINISGDIYVVAYSGNGDDGWLATVDIDSFGNIGPVIDTFEFNTSTGLDPDIIHISGDIYAIAYRGPGGDGWLATVEIDSFGGITNTEIDTFEFDTSAGLDPDIIHISGDIYAIAYRGNGADGWLATVDIDSSGNISTVVDTFEFDSSNGTEPDIISISGDIYAIAYRGPGNDGWLATVDIDSSGSIAGSTVDTFEYDSLTGREPSVIPISGDIYAIAYRGSGDDGWLATVDIDASGSIAGSTIDTFEYDNVMGISPSIVLVSGDVYAISYRGSGNDGWLVSLDIDASGTIGSIIDSLEFDSSQGLVPNILQVSGDTFAIVYEGTGNDGHLTTVSIASSALSGNAAGNFDMSDNQFLLHMNETSGTIFDDSSLNDNDANCATCPTLGVTGKLSTAFDFNGSNDFITAGDDLGQWLGDSSSLSVWINTTQTGDNTFWSAPGLTGVEEAGGSDDVFWGWIDASGRIGIQSTDTAGAQSTTLINDGVWHHVVMTRDATSGQVEIYIDGLLEDSAISGVGLVSTAFANIGRIDDTGGSPEYYEGLMDEFAIFDRVLDAAEVNRLWTRAALRLRLQLRSCDDVACSGESFIGPDGTSSTYYEEIDNGSTALPSLAVENMVDNQYFQYQVSFESDDTGQGPELLLTQIDCSVPLTGSFIQDGSGDFLVTMEAENFDVNTPQGIHTWNALTAQAGYVGSSYMRAEPDSGTNNNTSYDTLSPHLEYQVDFATTGTHYVWVRGYSASGTDDSVHAGLNGSVVSTADRIDIGSGSWQWSKATMDALDATIIIPSIGEHTIDIWMREDGFRLDRILLTTNAAYVPTGDGPVESTRGTAPVPTPFTRTHDDQTDFDLGTYSDTQWSVDHVALDSTGLSNGTGTYASEIFDSTDTAAIWDNFSWSTTSPYGKELPDSAAVESDYGEGNANMANNVLLMHMNESSGTILDTSGNGNDAIQSGGVTYGADGILNTALSFDGVDDLLTVSDSATLDITDDITIAAWIENTNTGATTGDITPALIDSFEFNTSAASETHAIHISGDVYAVVYRGSGHDGFVSTVEIDSSGSITLPVIDTFEFDNSQGREPFIFSVSGDIYGIAYRGPGGDGWLVTVEIDSAGSITHSVVDSFEYNTTYAILPSVINMGTNIYAIAYQGNGRDGFIATVDISTDGTINSPLLDDFEYETTNGRSPDIALIDANTVAITYRGDGSDGFVSTFDIDGSGNISSIIDTLEFDILFADYPELINITGDIYAVVYQGNGADGWLTTFDIDSGGVISSVIDTFEFDAAEGQYPEITNVTGDIFAISYEGPGDDGFIVTIDIDASGNIGSLLIDSFEFDTTQGMQPFTLPISGNIFAVFSTGSGTDGFVDTIEIETGGVVVPAGIAKSGAYELTVDGTTAYATVNGTSIASASLVSGLNHVALTYNKDAFSDQIKLYVNGALVNTGALTDLILTNANDLIIGEDTLGEIDEISIYTEVLSDMDILNQYKRGALNIQFQLRSCDDPVCSGESFVGPDGTVGDYYEELDNATVVMPDFAITNIAVNQYIQYQTSFTTIDNTNSPELESVNIDYTILVSGGGGGGGTYPGSGIFESQIFNSDSSGTSWETLYWSEILPIDTNITLSVRSGNIAIPDGSWSAWSSEFSNPEGEDVSSQVGQYLQYRATLTTTDFSSTPQCEDVTITYK